MSCTATASTFDISGATEFLIEYGCINEEPKSCTRVTHYVNLNTQQIFDALVTLYTKFFQIYASKFECIFSTVNISSDLSPQKYLALVYISNWFIDLHASNGKIVRARNECGIDIPKSYLELCPTSSLFGYDNYLAMLNAHIRPTRVKVGNVNNLYAPVVCNGSDFPEENPLGIEGFISNLPVCYSLMGYMQNKQCFRTSELCGKDVLGRPSWLLDWHGTSCYAWFPFQENYSMDDITIACILGVTCTPHLGHFDRDEWQYGLKSADTHHVDRVCPRTRHGFYEARVLETDNWIVPESVRPFVSPVVDSGGEKKRQKTNAENPERFTSEHNETLTSIKRFRVVDYLYFSKVFSKPGFDEDCRLNAWLKIIGSQFN